MKKIHITIFISIIFCMNIFSQEKIKIKDTISFRIQVPVFRNNTQTKKNYSKNIDKQNNTVSYQLHVLEPYFKYVLVDSTDSTYVVAPLSFKKYRENRINHRDGRFGFFKNVEIDKTIRSKLYNNKFFMVSKKDFERFSYKYKFKPKDRFSIGIISLPFKFRPQGSSSFDTEFNLNSTLNYRIGSVYSTDFYVQLGAGIGSVGLNSSNTTGTIIKDNPQDVAIWTGLSGFMLQYKKVQAGIYIGVDHINNQEGYLWKNNGNIWFGFGVGYELFKVNLTGDKKNNN